MNIEENPFFLRQLQRHEGLSLVPYKCPAGALTIGYGHNLDANPISEINSATKITKPRAIQILQEDCRICASQLDTYYHWWRKLSEQRQAVMLNMVFNLGINRFHTFKKTISAMHNGEYSKAGDEMMSSRWAMQVGKRAWELARQMKTDKWQNGSIQQTQTQKEA